MANCCHPSPPPNFLLLLLLLLITATYPVATAAGLLTSLTTTATAAVMGFQEIESMMTALRTHGSTLFTNAIATSDLKYQLFATSAASSPTPAAAAPFTIFAPKDTLLYALDMISDSATYISTLRYHIIPNQRRTFLDLQNLTSPFLDTLLPHYSVLIGKTQQDDLSLNTNTTSIGVMVDGVRVSEPDLFLSSTIAVHGIDGILVTGLNMYQDFNMSSPEGFDGDTAATLAPPPMPDYPQNWNDNIQTLAPAPAADESPKKKKKNHHGKRNNNNNHKRGRRGNHGRSRRRHRRLRGHRLDDL